MTRVVSTLKCITRNHLLVLTSYLPSACYQERYDAGSWCEPLRGYPDIVIRPYNRRKPRLRDPIWQV